MNHPILRRCCVAFAALLLAACGNKGDLVLPDQAEPAKPATATPAPKDGAAPDTARSTPGA